MYLQLWALGRTADVETLAEDGLPYVSASDIPVHGGATPHPLTIEEIEEYAQQNKDRLRAIAHDARACGQNAKVLG